MLRIALMGVNRYRDIGTQSGMSYSMLNSPRPCLHSPLGVSPPR